MKKIVVLVLFMFFAQAEAQGFFGLQTQPLAFGVHAGYRFSDFAFQVSTSLEYSQLELLYRVSFDGYGRVFLAPKTHAALGLGFGVQNSDAGKRLWELHLLFGLEYQLSKQLFAVFELRPLAIFFDPFTPPASLGVTFGLRWVR
jgi:hypothetical protein